MPDALAATIHGLTVADVAARLEVLVRGCGFVFTPDLSASRVMDWLAGLRERGTPRVALDPVGRPLGEDRPVLVREEAHALTQRPVAPRPGGLVARLHLSARSARRT